MLTEDDKRWMRELVEGAETRLLTIMERLENKMVRLESVVVANTHVVNGVQMQAAGLND